MSAPSSGPDLRPAALDDSALDDLRRVEERIGTPLVAYEAESPYAELTDEQLAEIRRAESRPRRPAAGLPPGLRLRASPVPHPSPAGLASARPFREGGPRHNDAAEVRACPRWRRCGVRWTPGTSARR